MRIVTWNCNRALTGKVQHLMKLDPHVAVIQECEKDFVAPAGYKLLWIGELPQMGLAVLCRDPDARVEPKPSDAWTFFLPVVLPNLKLRVLGVWAFHHRAGPERVGHINPVLDELGDWLGGGRSVMAGDFNHNLTWDTPRGKNNFRPIVHRLRELGLRSAYHESTLEGFNAETQATHLFRRKREAKYHIDYCFLHHSLPFQRVQVLDGEPWCAVSDHLPVVVDLDDRCCPS